MIYSFSSGSISSNHVIDARESFEVRGLPLILSVWVSTASVFRFLAMSLKTAYSLWDDANTTGILAAQLLKWCACQRAGCDRACLFLSRPGLSNTYSKTLVLLEPTAL